MNEEFINVFIETMNNKISDLTKSEMMLSTRLTLAEKLITALQEENTKLQASLNKKPTKNKEDSTF